MFDLIVMDQMVYSCLEASSDKENTIYFISESVRKVVHIESNTLYFAIASPHWSWSCPLKLVLDQVIPEQTLSQGFMYKRITKCLLQEETGKEEGLGRDGV